LNFPAGDLALQDLIRGRLIGREEEKNRTSQFLHDILSSKLLVASLATHEVYQKLADSGAEAASLQPLMGSQDL
jgi:signal transduction histidine kinase